MAHHLTSTYPSFLPRWYSAGGIGLSRLVEVTGERGTPPSAALVAEEEGRWRRRLYPASGGSRGGIGGQFPPSRSKIIKIHGIIIGSHTCNATFDTTSGLALQKLSLACI